MKTVCCKDDTKKAGCTQDSNMKRGQDMPNKCQRYSFIILKPSSVTSPIQIKDYAEGLQVLQSPTTTEDNIT